MALKFFQDAFLFGGAVQPTAIDGLAFLCQDIALFNMQLGRFALTQRDRKGGAEDFAYRMMIIAAGPMQQAQVFDRQ